MHFRTHDNPHPHTIFKVTGYTESASQELKDHFQVGDFFMHVPMNHQIKYRVVVNQEIAERMRAAGRFVDYAQCDHCFPPRTRVVVDNRTAPGA